MSNVIENTLDLPKNENNIHHITHKNEKKKQEILFSR